jgi:hypothetical protein
MRTTRFYLLLGMALLVVLALTGCQDSNTPRAVFTASMLEKVIPFNASFDGALSYDSNGKIKGSPIRVPSLYTPLTPYLLVLFRTIPRA